jgi:hypothetical protein
MTRRRAVVAAIAVALAMATAFAERAPGAQAQGVVTFDIDPDTTGNSENTLGTIENCAEITIPTPAFDNISDYNIDIVVFGDTQAPTEYYAELVYDSTKVHIAEPGTDDLIKMPGALSLSEAQPGSGGAHAFGAMYLDGGPGLPGDGALVRVGLDIGGSGVVTFTFTLSEPPQTRYTSVAGEHAVSLGRGHLAINASCAVGGIAELPHVGDSGAANRTALAASAVAAGLFALTAGAWYARRRRVR